MKPTPRLEDPLDALITEGEQKQAILAKLLPFVELERDVAKEPAELAGFLYKRARLAADIERVENSNSWDYCKVASIDFYKNQRRWIPIHPDAHWYQIGCVPPHFPHGSLMMVGEAFSGAHHLTTFWRYGEKYYCCLLTRREVVDEAFLSTLPFADDMPIMGQLEEGGG